MTEQIEPLTAADCDLRDFAFMPLDVVRLRDSDLAATESAEAFRAAVMLWCASWHQLPAASLPDDDRVLANLAGYGRVVKEWQKEREGALRGWIKCSDGRLYHPVVAEKAAEAWRGKLERQWRTECARIKKHSQRHGIVIEPLEFEVWLSSGRPQGQQLSVPKDKQTQSQGQENGCPEYVHGEMPSKGQGEGQGEGQGQVISPSLRSGDTAAKSPRVSGRSKLETRTLTQFLEACKAQGVKPVPLDAAVRSYCRDAGISDEMLQIAWLVFKDRHLNADKDKRYKDWGKTFANSVKDRWYKLWFDDSGEVKWTSTGLQEKRVIETRLAEQRQQHEGAAA